MKTFWIRTASATVYALLFLGSIYSGRLVGETWGTVILSAFALSESLANVTNCKKCFFYHF